MTDVVKPTGVERRVARVNMSKRPQVDGASVTAPSAETTIGLLGPGMTYSGIAFTRDETRALNKLYGFKAEKPNQRPPKPERRPDPEGTPEYKRWQADAAHKEAVAAWERWTDPMPFMQAGADRNVARHAEHDGLRLIAWLAKFVPGGEDPLKTLVQLAAEVGWDVDAQDIAWAEDP